LSLKDSKLVCSQDLLQSTAHRDAGLSGTDDKNGVVGMRIFAISMALMNSCNRRHPEILALPLAKLEGY
jgi:hypothetical protein